MIGSITKMYYELGTYKKLLEILDRQGEYNISYSLSRVSGVLADIEMLVPGQHETLLRQLDEAAVDLVNAYAYLDSPMDVSMGMPSRQS